MIDFTAQIYFKYIKKYLLHVTEIILHVTCNNKYHLQTAYSPITLPVNPPAVAVER